MTGNTSETQSVSAIWRVVFIRLARLILLFGIVIALLAAGCYVMMIRMPGKSFSGELLPITGEQEMLAGRLFEWVDALAGRIGPRNVMHSENLELARAYLESELAGMGYDVQQQTYKVSDVACSNVIAELPGKSRADEIIVVGAHYDSCYGAPGANDNASAVAGVLALAQRFASTSPQRTVRFVLFVNEEPPYFHTSDMGSLVYATSCVDRQDNIIAMVCLEMLGCYSDEPGSQSYPLPGLGLVYPDRGNFIAFVGNFSSRKLVRQVVGSFRQHAQFPSEGAALPAWVPGIGLSDHWSFWRMGYPAVMVTDTAMYRYKHYHHLTDTPDRLDYERMARVVEGLEAVVEPLFNPETETESLETTKSGQN